MRINKEVKKSTHSLLPCLDLDSDLVHDPVFALLLVDLLHDEDNQGALSLELTAPCLYGSHFTLMLEDPPGVYERVLFFTVCVFPFLHGTSDRLFRCGGKNMRISR